MRTIIPVILFVAMAALARLGSIDPMRLIVRRIGYMLAGLVASVVAQSMIEGYDSSFSETLPVENSPTHSFDINIYALVHIVWNWYIVPWATVFLTLMLLVDATTLVLKWRSSTPQERRHPE